MLFFLLTSNCSGNDFLESKLVAKLLSDYAKSPGLSARPVKNVSTPINLEFGVAVFQLLDLDTTRGILTLTCWTRHRWNDEILVWNPKDYGGIKNIKGATTAISKHGSIKMKK